MSDATSAPEFQRVEKGSKKLDDPQLTVNEDGQGYLNRAAREEWFEGVESLGVYFDPENKLIGFAPDEDHEDAYNVVHGENAGCSIVMSGALNALNVDRSSLDGKVAVPLRKNDNLIIADFKDSH